MQNHSHTALPHSGAVDLKLLILSDQQQRPPFKGLTEFGWSVVMTSKTFKKAENITVTHFSVLSNETTPYSLRNPTSPSSSPYQLTLQQYQGRCGCQIETVQTGHFIHDQLTSRPTGHWWLLQHWPHSTSANEYEPKTIFISKDDFCSLGFVAQTVM